MARTPSNMIPLGTKASDLALYDTVSKKIRSLEELKSPLATVIFFTSNHCYYAMHALPGILSVVKDYESKGVSFIAISANDIQAYPDDAPEKMAELAKKFSFSFPYLFDETQEVAKAYQAACTPDFYLFDAQLLCVYRGQLDDSRPANDIPVSGNDLRHALDCLLLNKPIPTDQKPSLGCNIKWK